jgi:hypothetical protein
MLRLSAFDGLLLVSGLSGHDPIADIGASAKTMARDQVFFRRD